MSEMVERVAAAVGEALSKADLIVHSRRGYSRDTFVSDVARAAIAAMREPTGTMEQSVDETLCDPLCAANIYRGMIDAALSPVE